LDDSHAEALSAIQPGLPKTDGQAVGLQAANNIIALRSGDGRMTPIGVTSSFPTLPPGREPISSSPTPLFSQRRHQAGQQRFRLDVLVILHYQREPLSEAS
jgi:hypothetical protein